jgi:predicted nucleotidyltransferase
MSHASWTGQVVTEGSKTHDRSWLKEAARRLRDDLDLELVLLFGSRARGTATRKSDMDLLVVW